MWTGSQPTGRESDRCSPHTVFVCECLFPGVCVCVCVFLFLVFCFSEMCLCSKTQDDELAHCGMTQQGDIKVATTPNRMSQVQLPIRHHPAPLPPLPSTRQQEPQIWIDNLATGGCGWPQHHHYWWSCANPRQTVESRATAPGKIHTS